MSQSCPDKLAVTESAQHEQIVNVSASCQQDNTVAIEVQMDRNESAQHHQISVEPNPKQMMSQGSVVVAMETDSREPVASLVPVNTEPVTENDEAVAEEVAMETPQMHSAEVTVADGSGAVVLTDSNQVVFSQTSDLETLQDTAQTDDLSGHVAHHEAYLATGDATMETHEFAHETEQSGIVAEEEETTTIFAYIDSEGNLRGRSSTGEDVLLQVQGDMPDELASDAILGDSGNVVVIQNCDAGEMLHTDGNVTYIVQEQPDQEDHVVDNIAATNSVSQPAADDTATTLTPGDDISMSDSQMSAPVGSDDQEAAAAATNLVYFEEEALETAEFQVVGVEVETQGGEPSQTEPSIIIDGCQVICNEPLQPQMKKKRSPSKSSSSPANGGVTGEMSPSKASNGNKPKKPRKRKSSQKDTGAGLPAETEEPKEKVTVQNLYDKSIEMCITENSSSQSQGAELTQDAPSDPAAATIATNAEGSPTKSRRRSSKGDGAKPRRRSKKTPERDGNVTVTSGLQTTSLSAQPRFEESDLSKTLNTATSVINQTMSAVGVEENSSGSSSQVAPVASLQQQAFNCRLCNKFTSPTEDEVKSHIVKEHARKICFIYRCDLCPAFFVTEQEITEHFRQKHPVAHVENISIVTNIEKALQTSADNIKIFYEQKKPGVSGASPPLMSPTPQQASTILAQMAAKENLTDKADLTPSDITTLLESQMKTVVSDKMPITMATSVVPSSLQQAYKSISAAMGRDLNLPTHPGTPTGHGPIHGQLETVQPPLSAPPQIPVPAGSQPYTTYVCKICSDFSSPIQWLVRNHVLSEHIRNFPSVVHLCYACPFVGKSKESINEHILKDHPGLPTNKVKVISDLEMLLILYASATDISQKGKIFHWNMKTNNHEEVQQGSQSSVLTKYVCSVCEKFETHFEWHLRHHIAQEHTEGVGYLCDLCCIFGTMEKHKAMLHSRLRHAKEQPNYKVLDWTVIFDTVVRVTDSYYTAKAGVATSGVGVPNYFFGSGHSPGASITTATSAGVTIVTTPPSPVSTSVTLPSIHSTFQATTTATAGHMIDVSPAETQLATVTTPIVQSVVKPSISHTKQAASQPVDYSMVVTQPTFISSTAVTMATTQAVTPAPVEQQRNPVILSVADSIVSPGTKALIANSSSASNMIPVPVANVQEQTVAGGSVTLPSPGSMSRSVAPPPPLVLPPSGPPPSDKAALGNDVHSFRCLVCHYTSLSLPDIVKHITVWHVDATMYPYTCPLCDLPGWEYNIILDHLRQIHKSSSYLPIINPGKVEFLRRYVNRFWIEHRPPSMNEASTVKTPRKRKRKVSVADQELQTTGAAALVTTPAGAVPPPQQPGTAQSQPVLQHINVPIEVANTTALKVTAPGGSGNTPTILVDTGGFPNTPVSVITEPATIATPAAVKQKPKRRRRSNQQKAIQESFQIPPPAAVMQDGNRPPIMQQPGHLDPRFAGVTVNQRQPHPQRPPQPNAVLEIPLTSPGAANPQQRSPHTPTVRPSHPPLQTPPIPPTPPTGNKKGRNLDKGIRYYCKLCNYSTPQLVYADSHAKCTHLKIRPFYCPYCTSFAGALEHKARMHVTFKHKDQPLRIEVNEEAVAVLEMEARKLYEARRTDDNSVVDMSQTDTATRMASAPAAVTMVAGGSESATMTEPTPSVSQPSIQQSPPPTATQVTHPIPAVSTATTESTATAVQQVVIPVPVSEEVITLSEEASQQQVLPNIPAIHITEPPSGGNELTDELQIAVQSLMEGPIPDDVSLQASVEDMTSNTVEETVVMTEEPPVIEVTPPSQPDQTDSEKDIPESALHKPEDTVSTPSATSTEEQQVATDAETLALVSEPVVMHAVAEIAETMASMSSQVVIHQRQQPSPEGAAEHDRALPPPEGSSEDGSIQENAEIQNADVAVTDAQTTEVTRELSNALITTAEENVLDKDQTAQEAGASSHQTSTKVSPEILDPDVNTEHDSNTNSNPAATVFIDEAMTSGETGNESAVQMEAEEIEPETITYILTEQDGTVIIEESNVITAQIHGSIPSEENCGIEATSSSDAKSCEAEHSECENVSSVDHSVCQPDQVDKASENTRTNETQQRDALSNQSFMQTQMSVSGKPFSETINVSDSAATSHLSTSTASEALKSSPVDTTTAIGNKCSSEMPPVEQNEKKSQEGMLSVIRNVTMEGCGDDENCVTSDNSLKEASSPGISKTLNHEMISDDEMQKKTPKSVDGLIRTSAENFVESSVKPPFVITQEMVLSITPDMVGDIAMDIIQETVSDLMRTISIQTVQDSNCNNKTKHFDKTHSVIVGRCTVDSVVPCDVFSKTKSKLMPLSQQHKECLTPEILTHTRTADLIVSLKSKLYECVKRNGKHLPEDKPRNGCHGSKVKAMPLSVKLAKYPTYQMKQGNSPPSADNKEKDEITYGSNGNVDGLAISKRCFFCKRCMRVESTRADIEAHIQLRHVSVWPYSCSYCTFRSSDHQTVQQHIDSAHSTENRGRILTDHAVLSQLRRDTEDLLGYVYTTIADSNDEKLFFLKPVVTLPNIFQVLKQSGNL